MTPQDDDRRCSPDHQGSLDSSGSPSLQKAALLSEASWYNALDKADQFAIDGLCLLNGARPGDLHKPKLSAETKLRLRLALTEPISIPEAERPDGSDNIPEEARAGSEVRIAPPKPAIRAFGRTLAYACAIFGFVAMIGILAAQLSAPKELSDLITALRESFDYSSTDKLPTAHFAPSASQPSRIPAAELPITAASQLHETEATAPYNKAEEPVALLPPKDAPAVPPNIATSKGPASAPSRPTARLDIENKATLMRAQEDEVVSTTPPAATSGAATLEGAVWDTPQATFAFVDHSSESASQEMAKAILAKDLRKAVAGLFKLRSATVSFSGSNHWKSEGFYASQAGLQSELAIAINNSSPLIGYSLDVDQSYKTLLRYDSSAITGPWTFYSLSACEPREAILTSSSNSSSFDFSFSKPTPYLPSETAMPGDGYSYVYDPTGRLRQVTHDYTDTSQRISIAGHSLKLFAQKTLKNGVVVFGGTSNASLFYVHSPFVNSGSTRVESYELACKNDEVQMKEAVDRESFVSRVSINCDTGTLPLAASASVPAIGAAKN